MRVFRNDFAELVPHFSQFEWMHYHVIGKRPLVSRETDVSIPCVVCNPYSQSSSCKFVHKMFCEIFLDSKQCLVVVFSTCGIVSAELGLMYLHAHHHHMLGNAKNLRVKDDSFRIETLKIIDYLEKMKFIYKKCIAYCISVFRAVMEVVVIGSQIPIEVHLNRSVSGKSYCVDCLFPEIGLFLREHFGMFRVTLLSQREA
jgi:predicted RNA-binding protein